MTNKYISSTGTPDLIEAMSQTTVCRLCMKSCKEYRSLYHEDGHKNELYDVMIKYFDPQYFYVEEGYHLTTVCLECLDHVISFHNFQQSVYQARNTLLTNFNVAHIKNEKDYPNEGYTEVIVKSDVGDLPENVSIFNYSNNFVDGPTGCEIEGQSKLNKEFTESGNKSEYGFLAVNNSFTETGENSIQDTISHDKTEPMISLPKLELIDVYSGDESSQGFLSDECDDPNDSYLGEEFRQSDYSNESSRGLISIHLPADRKSAAALQASDEFIAQLRPSFECELCSEACSTYSLLRQHFNDKHPLEKCYFKCCKKMLASRYRVEEHVRLHIDPNAFKCELCDKNHNSRYRLTMHMRNQHHFESNLEGSKMWKSRITDKELNELIAQWLPNIECVVCKKMYPTLKLLQMHFRQNHPQHHFQIECCQRRFKRRYGIESHIRLHLDPNAYKCELCHKRLKDRKYLLAHMRSFHSQENKGERKKPEQKMFTRTKVDELLAHEDFAAQAKSCLKCILCSEMCQTYLLLRQHFQDNHPREKFYMLCCQRKFSGSWRIESHLRLHINPNAYKCDLCGIQFNDIDYLYKHKQKHHPASCDRKRKRSNKKLSTNEEMDDLVSQWIPELKCVLCSKTFAKFTLLSKHFRRNHKQKQFKIECCQRMLMQRRNIEDHIRLHIDPDAFKCDLCCSRFKTRTILLHHLSSKHSNPSGSGEMS